MFFDGSTLRGDRLGHWVDLLSSVSWAGHHATFHGVTRWLEPGQIMTSYATLGKRWGVGKSHAWRFMRELERAGMITTLVLIGLKREWNGVRNGSRERGTERVAVLVTVCNWPRWQGGEEAVGTGDGTGVGNGVWNETGTQTEEVKKEQQQPRACESTPEPETARTVQSTPELTDAELTRPAARIWEAFQREAGLARPPSAREMDRLRGTIRALGGRHEGLLFDVVEITREAVGAGKKLGSIAYCLAAWEGRQRDKQAEAARLAGLGVKASSPVATVAADPPAELTDEQRAGAVSACRDVLARLEN